jgi:phosphoribosylaminoimidazole-succinocarboxamide synthase
MGDAMAERAVMETTLALPGLRRGKVRDVYTLPPKDGTPRLLIVASDRISAFDVVMPTPIAGKGVLLTRLSTFWLRFVERKGICSTHLLSTRVDDIPTNAFTSATTRQDLDGRSTIARQARVIPIECVVRGYLEGSGWREYKATGRVCGIDLPVGLSQCARLPQPIFTPATKEDLGKHDENISFEQACERVGHEIMDRLRSLSLAIYTAAAAHALDRGILIADTKFEFGFPVDEHGEITSKEPMLVDEALTPDSSRFWPADHYQPGKPQASFDKQFLREYLESLVASGIWDKQAPGPVLPPKIVEQTLAKYREALDRLTP